MPFVDDSQYEKMEKKEELKERVMKKKEDQQVKTMFQGDDEKKKAPKISFKDIQRAMGHDKNQEEKPITLKEMKSNLKVNEFVEEKTKEEIDKLLKKNEMKEIKDEAVGLLALPQQHPIKRYILHTKLKESEIINDYIDKNVIYRMATYANDTVKFGVVYALKFIQTEADFKRYEQQRQEQLMAQQATQKPKQEEEKKEEQKASE